MTDFFKPYEGSNPYLFISYSHRNSPAVFSIVRHMQKDGYLCWIDRRLQGGSRWSGELARRIEGCACSVLFLSQTSSTPSLTPYVRSFFVLIDGFRGK